jgi:LSD1 subclass zinc finger protein
MPVVQPQRLWGLALAGVLTEMNSAHHDELGMWGLNEHTRPWCTNVLRDSYGVGDEQAFNEMVHWLATEGHTAEARATISTLGPSPIQDQPKQAIARSERARIQEVGLLAWDVGRLVAVVGWGFWAGFIEEDAAWKTILGSAVRVQRAYDSWRAYGEAYMFGRFYWSGGQTHEGSQAAYQRLLGNPASPWNRLPWKLDFGFGVTTPSAPGLKGVKEVKVRFKKSICPACGGHKTRPSQTAYVYCDFCGALADFDFQKACEVPAERPGPAYQNLSAQLAPMLEQARGRGDVVTYRQLQMQLFDSFIAITPTSCPPRVTDARYRQAYVAYMAEGATATAFDAASREHEGNVNRTVQGLQYASPKPGVIRVSAGSFRALSDAVFAQQDHVARIHEARGVYAMHPDHAPAELQRRIGISLFVQGWLPMLDEDSARAFLDRARLSSEYLEADPPSADRADCGGCGHHLEVLPGARRVVCERCGQAVELGGERVTCGGCGASLAPQEGAPKVTCPHCKHSLQRVGRNWPV